MSTSYNQTCEVSETSQVFRWSERLRAIAQTGLAFQPDGYDAERYVEVLKVAAEMAATAQMGQMTDVDGLVASWREAILPGVDGYVTPKVGIDAMVFNPQGELLLMQRSDSGLWYLPCGWADVGYAPAEVVVKEVL